MESWVEKLVFCSDYNEPSLFENLHAESAALSKNVIHYGSRLGFSYYNPTTPHRDGSH
jgi:hypothetical protein